MLTKADILRVVQKFYSTVRTDELLGPVFTRHIPDAEWNEHIEHIGRFWESIFLQTKTFTGNPMRKHLALAELTPEHFSRWLALFEDAAKSALRAEKAKLMCDMANRIAQSFQMGIAFHRDNQAASPEAENGAGEQTKPHAFSAFSVLSRRPT